MDAAQTSHLILRSAQGSQGTTPLPVHRKPERRRGQSEAGNPQLCGQSHGGLAPRFTFLTIPMALSIKKPGKAYRATQKASQPRPQPLGRAGNRLELTETTACQQFLLTGICSDCPRPPPATAQNCGSMWGEEGRQGRDRGAGVCMGQVSLSPW